ncbi:MAG: peptide deformylase [Thermotogaceae bacterium]|jgi:peptide deformylase|nr:peptide deformylase [Thermotogaceae bacterium]
MEMKLRFYGDPVLREKAEKVTEFDEELHKIIEDMATLMYKEDGAGLAGPQVGLKKQIFIEDDGTGSGWRAYINPEILYFSDEKDIAEEGCLSIPDIFEDVERSKMIKVRYQLVDGTQKEEEISSYLARIIQHETDHLNGVLFIDHISKLKKRLLKKKLDVIKEKAKEVYMNAG